jgi:3-methyl-2-oxobutanoate hydroxymethyltransferase
MPSIRNLALAKANQQKIVVVTSYDASTARLLAETPVDCLLVGDSAMMVIHGERDTLGATIELMTMHTRAVAKGAPDKLIVTDFPFLAARQGIAHALNCAAQLMRAGAHAVKIEGIRGHAEVVRHLVESGVPVMGHLGLQPQSVHALGGYMVQGREQEDAARLHEDAVALEAAGAFAVVLECIPGKLAQEITASLSIPTIGIGAGVDCDGQVLVLNDLLGLNPEFKAKFVRHFADGAKLVRDGVTRFATDVRAQKFPSPKETFK